MKKYGLVAILLSVLVFSGCKGTAVDLKQKTDKASYAIGQSIGKDMKTQNLELKPSAVARGIEDAFAGKSLMKDDEIKSTLEAFQQEQIVKQQARMKEMSEKNGKEGKSFLEANKTKEGVVTLPSGLQYKIITKGTGTKSPGLTDRVSVHYKGSLINGKEFDSSYSRNQPAEFQVDQVIKGWTEALQKMKKGDKWTLYIPAELAYGERGAGSLIPPNSVLIFEVELLDIK